MSAGCSGGGHHQAANPNAVTADHWTPPTVTGPPSTANFCALLIASYHHVGTLAEAPALKVRRQILDDFVAMAPKISAAAPASIETAAATYFKSVADVLGALSQAGLNPQKAKPIAPAESLLAPKVEAASRSVLTFSAQQCHYTIGTG